METIYLSKTANLIALGNNESRSENNQISKEQLIVIQDI